MASTKAENKNSFGSKRSKNDGDWTCQKCGNLNFSFRTVCNRGPCSAPRPSLSPKIGSGHTPGPGAFDHPSYYLGGVGAPPPMPLGMHGDYRMPLSFSGMRYPYGPSSGMSGPYGMLPGYGPPGLMGGMNYGPGSGMDGYGYGYRGSPMPVPNSWPGGDVADNNASRKRRGGPDGLSEGDWICPKCENVNFAFRTSCNMKKCGAPRPDPVPSGKKDSSATAAPEGSWTCEKCGNVNYPFREKCNKKGCSNPKPGGGNQ